MSISNFYSNCHIVLCRYEAEIDQGHGYRCCHPWALCLCLPHFWMWALSRGLGELLKGCSCDESVCWLRKEYSTRTFFRVYPNRIEFNVPQMRIPFGFLGCGSWNADYIKTHVSTSYLREKDSVEYCETYLILFSDFK